MKRTALLLLLLVVSLSMFSQNEFSPCKTDTSTLTKNQIYSQTKMFITDYWKSARTVIQNDDKESGVIQLKGLYSSKEFSDMFGNNCTYNYEYTIKFRQKDFKYKIEIYDVACVNAVNRKNNGSMLDIPKIQPFVKETDQKTSAFLSGGISKKKSLELMDSLQAYLKEIVDSYENYIKKSTSKSDDF